MQDGGGGDPQPLTLYQSEGSPHSRLVREALCSLEILYHSISAAEGTATALPSAATEEAIRQPMPDIDPPGVPILVDKDVLLVGSQAALEYLNETYSVSEGYGPSWLDPLPEPNLGRCGKISTEVFGAVGRGWKKFVPENI